MKDSVTLISGEYSADILLFGAELCSLKHLPSNTEFLWQADPMVWPRHSPILFPFVGRLNNFKYQYQANYYTIEQHGFARDMVFNMVSQSPDSVSLQLTESHYTLERYPFSFRFVIDYHLNQNKLTTNFIVENLNNFEMPVSFGGHPAFNINHPDDTIIQFEKDLNPPSFLINNGLISDKTKQVSNGNGIIMVNSDTFEKDALVFKNLQSNWVKICSKTSSKSITVVIENWPFLGLWAKPNSDFICIEPWQGIADAYNFEGEVSEKEGILMINSFEKRNKSYEIVMEI